VLWLEDMLGAISSDRSAGTSLHYDAAGAFAPTHDEPMGASMTFQESIRTCLTKYADFTGRASRPEYWWFILFTVLVSVACSIVSDYLSAIFSLAVLLPSIAAATRRLHDTGRSGWWQLNLLVPIVGLIVLIVFLAQEGTAEPSPA
jgi:hypothetical protein